MLLVGADYMNYTLDRASLLWQCLEQFQDLGLIIAND